MKEKQAGILSHEAQETGALALDVRDGHLSLPYTTEQFAGFLEGLLGRPQEISRTVEGVFEINRENIKDLHHLLGQRIAQQNRGSLVAFQARLVFDDRSSVTCRSVEELISYNETRPLASEALHITWDYLLEFEDKSNLERQRIEFSIQASATGNPVILNSPPGKPRKSSASKYDETQEVGPYFSYTISHTARTWATDIDTLLSNYIQSLLLPQSRLLQVLRKHRKIIGTFFGGTFLMLGMVGLFMAQIEHSRPDIPLFEDFASSFPESTESEAGLAYLVHIEEMRTHPDHGRMWLFPVCLIVISAIGSFLRVGIANLANLRRRSFILLTGVTEKQRKSAAGSLVRKQVLFWLSVSVSLASGVAANGLYSLLTN